MYFLRIWRVLVNLLKVTRVLVLSGAQRTFVVSVKVGGVWMMDCAHWLVVLIIRIRKWSCLYLLSIILFLLWLFTNLLSLSSLTATLVVHQVLLRRLLQELLVASSWHFIVGVVLINHLVCLFLRSIHLPNRYLRCSSLWFGQNYLDTSSLRIRSFRLCFNRMTYLNKLLGLVIRCFAKVIIPGALQRLSCMVKRIISSVSFHDLYAFHFWIVYFYFPNILCLGIVHLSWGIRSLLLLIGLLP